MRNGFPLLFAAAFVLLAACVYAFLVTPQISNTDVAMIGAILIGGASGLFGYVIGYLVLDWVSDE